RRYRTGPWRAALHLLCAARLVFLSQRRADWPLRYPDHDELTPWRPCHRSRTLCSPDARRTGLARPPALRAPGRGRSRRRRRRPAERGRTGRFFYRARQWPAAAAGYRLVAADLGRVRARLGKRSAVRSGDAVVAAAPEYHC